MQKNVKNIYSETLFTLFATAEKVAMVFSYQNCSDLLWEKLLKFEAEGREFPKCLGSLEQFIQTAKGQNNFW